jgi:branched-chain amino acid transport system ATP-binding protein
MSDETLEPPAAAQGQGLELKLIGVRFGGLQALDNVSLTVPPGSVTGIIGPNGAGKTTLFNVICGFVRPQTGAISWNGVPLRPRPHRLARLGITRTLQGLGLFGGLTVLENVLAGASGSPARHAGAVAWPPRPGQAERAARAAAHRCLEDLGIAEYASSAPGALPYAVRKRVALARALMSRPRLLLLDEPAGGLSPVEVTELAGLIRALPDTAGCSVMLVEHHMDLVMDVCRHVVVLDFGRVIAAGAPEAIRNDPDVAAAYLGTEVAS